MSRDKRLSRKLKLRNCQYMLFGKKYSYNPIPIAYIRYYTEDKSTGKYLAHLGIDLIGMMLVIITVILILLLNIKFNNINEMTLTLSDVAYISDDGKSLEVNIINNNDVDVRVVIKKDDVEYGGATIKANSSLPYISLIKYITSDSYYDINIINCSNVDVEFYSTMFVTNRIINNKADIYK